MAPTKARPKLSAQLKGDVAASPEVALKPVARKMVVQRCEEHATLHTQIKELEARKKRLGAEIVELFEKEGVDGALYDGTKVAGHSIKVVLSNSSKFDKLGFMKAHHLTEDDFAEFTSTTPKAPYVKMVHPGDHDDDN